MISVVQFRCMIFQVRFYTSQGGYMALTNAQYDEIMRGYDKRQLQNKYIHDKRI